MYAGSVPTLLIVVLNVVPVAAFALIHGRLIYGRRGILLFTVLCLSTGTFFESLSLRTGFPFGHYYFTDVMGPKVFQLPVLLALAYLGMGYLSWTVTVAIAGYQRDRLSGLRLFQLPLLASFVMVAWDLSMDPIWTYIGRAWVWTSGGAYFGVPVSNFAGWFLTVYTFYQAFALYLARQPERADERQLPRSRLGSAVLFYAASAAGNLLVRAPRGMAATVVDPSGRQWRVADMIAANALVSVLLMGAFAVTAWSELSKDGSEN